MLTESEQWSRVLDKKAGVFVIHLDFRKAFDGNPNLRLLQNLKLHTWIQSFLTKGTPRVKVGEGYYKFIGVTSMTP